MTNDVGRRTSTRPRARVRRSLVRRAAVSSLLVGIAITAAIAHAMDNGIDLTHARRAAATCIPQNQSDYEKGTGGSRFICQGSGAPVDDYYSTPENVLLAVDAPHGLLSNDRVLSADDPSTHAALMSVPSHGTLVMQRDGSFGYRPDPDYSGADSFTYCMANDYTLDPTSRVNEHRGFQTDDPAVCSYKDYGFDPYTATVHLDVTAVFNPAAPPPTALPKAVNDAYTTVQDHALSIGVPGVLFNDVQTNATDGALQQSNPAHGSATLNQDGSFLYTPAPGFIGTDSFRYCLELLPPAMPHSPPPQRTPTIVPPGVANAIPACKTPDAVVTITVLGLPPEGRPVALDDRYTTALNTALAVHSPGVRSNDFIPGVAWQAIEQSAPAHGTVSLTPDGSFVYTPTTDHSGTDSYTYCIGVASTCASNIATVTISIPAPRGGILTERGLTPGGRVVTPDPEPNVQGPHASDRGGLPITGASVLRTGLVGLSLLLLGIDLAVMGRRRRLPAAKLRPADGDLAGGRPLRL